MAEFARSKGRQESHPKQMWRSLQPVARYDSHRPVGSDLETTVIGVQLKFEKPADAGRADKAQDGITTSKPTSPRRKRLSRAAMCSLSIFLLPSLSWAAVFPAQEEKDKPARIEEGAKLKIQTDDSASAGKATPKRSFFDLVKGKLKDSTITLRKPHFRFSLADASSLAKAIPQIRTKVVDARVTLLDPETKEPIVDLTNLSFIASTKATKTGKVLTVEPTKIVDRQPIKPELFTKGLEFVAPLLADATKMSGSVTLEIRKCVIRFEGEKPVVESLDGRLVLHDVQSTTSGATADAVRVLSTALRLDIPRQVHVVDGSTVDFQVIDDRVHHNGLAFLLPGLANDLLLTSSGTVGFDRSLDVTLSVNLPREGFADSPVMRKITDQPLELALTGTVDKPTLGIAKNQTLIDVLASRLAPTPNGRAEPVSDALLRLVDGLTQPRPQVPGEPPALPGSILNLIRSVQERNRRAQPAAGSPRVPRRPVRRRRMNRRRFPPGKNPQRPLRPPLSSQLAQPGSEPPKSQ